MLIRIWFVSLLVVISEITATYLPNLYENEVNQDEDLAKQQPTTIFIIETPGGGPVDDRCPCLPAMLCPRVFGTSPQDVPTFGELPICEDPYFVRCCGVSTHYEIGEPALTSPTDKNSPEPSASDIEEVLTNLDTPIEPKSVYIFPELTREDDTSDDQQDPHAKEEDNVMYIYPNVMSGEIHKYPEVQDGISAIKVQDKEGTDILVVFPNKDNESFLKVVDALEANFQNEDELDEFIKSGSERVQVESNTPVRNYKYIPLTDTTEASTKSPGRRRTNLRRKGTTTTTTTTESPVVENKEIKMKQILTRLSTIYKQRHPTKTVTTTEPETSLSDTKESPKQNLRITDIDTTQATTTTTTSKPEIIPQTFPSRQSILRTLHPESTPIVMNFNISEIMNNSTEEDGQKQLETPENNTQVLLENVQKMLAAKLTDIQNELTQKLQTKIEQITEKSETSVSNNLKVHPVTVVDATTAPPPSPRGNRRYRKGYTSTTTALPETSSYTVKSKSRAGFKPRTRYLKTTTNIPEASSTEKYHSRFRNIETTTGKPEGSVSPTFRSRFRKFETSTVPETTTTQSRFRNIDTTTGAPEVTGSTTLRSRFRSVETSSVSEITVAPIFQSRFRNSQTTAGGETTALPTFQPRFKNVEANSTPEVAALPVIHSRSRNTQTTTVVPEIITPVHRLRNPRPTGEPEISSPPTLSPRQRLATELTMNINSNVQKNKQFKPSVLLSVYDSEEDEVVDDREFLRQGRSAFKDPTSADIESGFMPIYGVKPIRVIGPIPKGYVQFEEDGLDLDLPNNEKGDAAFSK